MNSIIVKREKIKIKEIFKKNNYSLEEKIIFLEAQKELATALNDDNMITACDILFKELKEKE